jgi:GTPase SAR1 family protein
LIYFLGVSGYILCFAIDDSHSFEILKHVNKILLESIGTKYVPRVIVANKKDLNSRR